ncbi:hypothetical protein [Micromonospora sp. WMMD737]|uniref:hypothetical protein n=1 Tax=Micromonospora sp. WMMD737 TaxID=3404113 RepID=UPI003B951E7A
MPRVTVPVTNITRSGVAPAAEVNGDPANNHQVANNGNTFLLVRNANGAATARTLGVVIKGAIDGFAPAPRTYSIPAGASRYIGPFDAVAYGSLMEINVDNAELKLSAYTL